MRALGGGRNGNPATTLGVRGHGTQIMIRAKGQEIQGFPAPTPQLEDTLDGKRKCGGSHLVPFSSRGTFLPWVTLQKGGRECNHWALSTSRESLRSSNPVSQHSRNHGSPPPPPRE